MTDERKARPVRLSHELLESFVEQRRMQEERAAFFANAQHAAKEAATMSELLDAIATPRELRQRASLVIRCADCAGRGGQPGFLVAHVTYIEQRPLLWTAQRSGPGTRSWLDDGWWGDYAYCREREWPLFVEDLEADLPPLGAPKRVIRVSHPVDMNAVP